MQPRALTLGRAAFLLAFLLCADPALGQDGLRLIEAARHEDVAAVRALVEARAAVDAAQPDGATALHWAVHRDDLEIADVLLRAGADANATNELGVAPLSLACINGSATMVEKLLAHGADVAQALPTGVTPLMTCARTGNVDAVESLLARGARVNHRETMRGQTALMWAVSEKHSDVAAALIAAGADVRARSHGEFTPLLFAAQQGDVASARLLLDAGVDVNEAGGDGSEALLVATESRHPGVVRFLLEAGADVDAIGAGRTALHAAVQQKRRDIVELLLAGGANVDARLLKRLPRVPGDLSVTSGPLSMVGATPFWLAAKFADLDLMRLLADRGADTRLANGGGATPLMVAAGLGWVDGSDRYGRVKFNDDPVRRERHDLEAVKLAMELGGDVHAVDDHGQTAMHGAAYMGGDTIVQFLADRGASVDVADNDGWTPLSIAEGLYVGGTFQVRPTTAALLRQLGAGRGGQ